MAAAPVQLAGAADVMCCGSWMAEVGALCPEEEHLGSTSGQYSKAVEQGSTAGQYIMRHEE
jgi:hypothetical protein